MFANNLKKYRKNSKLTQSELAKKLSVSQSTIGMYECGQRGPDIDMLTKIASILDVTIDDLLGYKYTGGEVEIPCCIPDKQYTNTAVKSYSKSPSKQKTLTKDEFLKQADVMFMDVSEEDRDMLYKTLTDIYFDSKAKNKVKYNPNKNREK